MRAFLRRLAGPVPLAAVSASALTFWATGLWWLLPAGVAAGAVAAMLAHRDAEPTPIAPDPPPRRAALRPLLEERSRILAELENGGPALDAADVAARVNRVVEAYDGLLAKLEVVRSLLAERGLSEVDVSIDDLERQLASCADEVTRQNLSLAVRNRKDERERLREMDRYRERVGSQLLSLASSLTNLRVRLVQGRVSEDGALDAATGISEVLESLFHEVEVAEKTSRELNRIVERVPRRASAERG